MNKKYSFKRTIMIPASIAIGLNDLLKLRNKNTTNKKRFVDFHILFDKKKTIENFRNLSKVYPAQKVKRKGHISRFDYDLKDMNVTYSYNGKQSTLDEFLKNTMATGLLIMKDHKVVNERYFHGNTCRSLNTSWSVAKSFLSALVGIAIDEGDIKSVKDPIIAYLPELKNSGYKNVSIKECLQMCSGIYFNEDYHNLSSDFYMLMQASLTASKSVNEYINQFKYKEFSRGFSYKSIDAQVLGMLIAKATGRNLAQYLQEKIWGPLGMESHAFWNIGSGGSVIPYSFLNATLRDFARFGLLYLQNGNWKGKQIISQEWIRESTIPERYNLLKDNQSHFTDNYQYQWWTPGPDYIVGEFLAIGIWGQNIYINQPENLVIVRTSADPSFEKHHYEMYAVYRAIVDFLRKES
ncbi:serine hydrolase [Bacillus pseudomycoides]|uniref:serine hydrolase domain-containing protein n=1 Tax=Bacillus pseudomycoides TaxID=64104 RepID=UPI000BEBB218|nr:serine hydrolase [Bacillus pseudomycoides]PEA84339.1 serine hydrolase [Bacillus pseudomycoides]PFZ07595.1 serine hydrolase [Bacillus pseudomycoides]